MQEYIEWFLTYLGCERGYTTDTQRTYGSALNVFAQYLREQEINVAEVDRDTVRGWLTWMADRGNSPASRAARLTCLRMFYEWAEREGIADNVAADVDGPKVREPEMEWLSRSEAEQLLDTVREHATDRLRERDVAIVSLFLACGLRRSELIGINLDDIDLQRGTVRVTRKGRRTQVLPLSEFAKAGLREYLQVRPDCDTDALFVSRGTRMGDSTVWDLVKKYFAAAGLEGSPVTLRHTFASSLVRAGTHMRVIQELMGHRDIRTTQRYTHVDDDLMRQATEAVSF